MSGEYFDSDKTRSMMILAPGTIVSHYRVLEKIGSGGMGEVYLAEDTTLNRKVALKFLSPNASQEPDGRTRFKREAQAVATLNHPNIVTIYEVGEFNDRPFLAMEYINGPTLQKYCESSPESKQLLLIGLKIADGLQAAHAKGVVHRDIKPTNILIAEDSQPKILDFGLAKVSSTEELTKEHTMLGTLSYMSPEQLQGGKVDHRSDIFSLGVVLYESLTGKHPFRAEYEAATVYNITQTSPQVLSGEISRRHPLIQLAISKALQKNPDDRYQSMAEFAADLERSIGGSVTIPKQRLKISRLIAGLAIVALVTTLLVMFWPFGDNKTAEQSPTKRILVIPFRHLGPPEQAYVASGISSELMSTLVSMNGVKVVPQLTAERFRDSKLKLGEIGRELGVQYVLDGTVQWEPQVASAPSRVRVVVELIDVAGDVMLWSARYDTTAQQLLDIQSDIAEKVALETGSALEEGQKNEFDVIGTRSQEAHDCLLRGNEYLQRDLMSLTSANVSYAIELFDRAIQLDSGYALAYAKKSIALIGLGRCEEAKAAVLRSLELSPGLQSGNEALGIYYSECMQDWTTALHYWDVAYSGDRDNVDYLRLTAKYFIQVSQFDKAYENTARAVKLEPNSSELQTWYCISVLMLRRYDEAEAAAERIIARNPEWWTGYYLKAMSCVLRDGNAVCARPAVETAARLVNSDDQWWLYEIYNWVHVLDSDFSTALREAKNAPFGAEHWERGLLYFYMGDHDLMRGQFDTVLVDLRKELAGGGKRLTRARLAVVLAGLGQREEAIKFGHEALALQPLSGTDLNFHWHLALAHTMIGEGDSAISELDSLLSIPGPYSMELLKHDPAFSSLNNNPRFASLIEAHR